MAMIVPHRCSLLSAILFGCVLMPGAMSSVSDGWVERVPWRCVCETALCAPVEASLRAVMARHRSVKMAGRLCIAFVLAVPPALGVLTSWRGQAHRGSTPMFFWIVPTTGIKDKRWCSRLPLCLFFVT